MDVRFTVIDRNGESKELEIPDDLNLSLMEALKADGYNILATCGGMALCATCHVKVLKGLDNLAPKNDAEWDMLDTLPDAAENSRLACQIRIAPNLEGAELEICGEEEE